VVPPVPVVPPLPGPLSPPPPQDAAPSAIEKTHAAVKDAFRRMPPHAAAPANRSRTLRRAREDLHFVQDVHTAGPEMAQQKPDWQQPVLEH
jgi:hypothetical protein